MNDKLPSTEQVLAALPPEQSKFHELLTRQEKIDPELKMYERPSALGGLCIHHPLVIELFYDPERAALINERYRLKKADRDKSYQDGKWHRYVFVHERPYRIQALWRAILAQRVRQDQFDFPQLVREAWTDSENIQQNKTAWQDIWRGLQNPHDVMDANEKTAYSFMPDEVTIHRGVRHVSWWPKGMSWTRDKEKAVWFAHRWPQSNKHPTVVTATVSKKDILAYIHARGEDEVVVFPRTVRNVVKDVR